MSRVTELVFKGDNRSAIRALKEIGDQSTTTSGKVRRGSEESATSMERVGKSAGRMKELVAGAAGMIGLGGLAFGFKDAAEGGIQLQGAQAQLQASLRATGQAGGDAYTRLTDAAERLSTHGGFTTPQNLSALTAFTRETHSATQATGMLSLATNIARGRNMDLSSAQQIVSRAYTGSVGRLQQLLGPMVAAKSAAYGLTQAHKEEVLQLSAQSKAMGAAGPLWLKQQEIIRGITPQMQALVTLQDKHATATQVMAAAQTAFGSATSTYANTTQGRLSDVRNSISNLVDTLGEGLLPIMNRTIGVITSVVSWLNKNRVVMYALMGGIAAVTGVLTAHAIVTEVVKAKTIALGAAQRLLGISSEEAAAGEETATAASVGLGAAMDAIPILALIAGIVLLVTHFKQVKEAASAVFAWLKGAVTTVVNWIGNHWKMLAVGGAFFLGGPFLALPVFVATHFAQVKQLASSVVAAIGRVFSTVFHVIAWPFQEGWKIIKGIFNGIVAGIRWTVNEMKTIWNNSPFGGLVNAGSNLLHGNVGGAAHSLLHGLSFGLLHAGGPVKPKYLWGGGPVGQDVIPGYLSTDEGVLTGLGMRGVGGPQGLASLNSGQHLGGGSSLAERITLQPGQVVVNVQLGVRQIARVLAEYQLQMAARGPSSLSGGSLATNVVGGF